MDYRKRSHSVCLLTYHIVLVTKYRKPLIDDDISVYLKQYAAYLCRRFDGELLSAETDTDHMHLQVSLPASVAPAEFVRSLKTQLSRELHKDEVLMAHVRKHLSGDAPFWSPSYFIVTTGGASIERINEYIASQRTDGHRRKYVKSGKFKGRRRVKSMET